MHVWMGPRLPPIISTLMLWWRLLVLAQHYLLYRLACLDLGSGEVKSTNQKLGRQDWLLIIHPVLVHILKQGGR